MALTDAPALAESIQVPLPRVAAFVRQVTHDIRNSLNSMDLQAAFAMELSTDPEVSAEVKRIRELVQSSARQLQALSANFWSAKPNTVAYSAGIFVEDLQDRLTRVFPDDAASVQWRVNLDDVELEIDIEMIFSAVAELFRNAFSFRVPNGEISVHVCTEKGLFHLELSETKETVASEPATWGREPFVSARRGGYGLGLFRARTLVELHQGDLTFDFDSARKVLRTRLTLPA